MNAQLSFVTQSGRPLRSGGLLGRGGEGEIYHVADDPALAIKLYTDGREQERLPKIQAMLADKRAQQTAFVAFPQDIVRLNGRFAGFVMRKAVDARPLVNLCLSIDRKHDFPQADYRFLVRVALNYARALAWLHARGIVVGDINESGALIGQDGRVILIDADSFQYTAGAGGRTFRCTVGKPEFTPPELQGRSLRDIDRTTEHDAFGLAVILFELLFLGRHPFQGIPRAGDPPMIPEAIAAHRFAYSPHKAVTCLDPPPHMPVLADVPSEVALAFQQSFGPYQGGMSRTRPTAPDWVRLLESMETQLTACRAHPAHHHWKGAPGCPWCRFEAGYPVILFLAYAPTPAGPFDLDKLLDRIHAIATPGPLPELLSLLCAPLPLPSAQAKKVTSRRRQRRVGGIGLAVLVAILMAYGYTWFVILLLPAARLAFRQPAGLDEIRRRRSTAGDAWQLAQREWSDSAGPARFDTQRAGLLQQAATYRGLPALEARRLADLDKRKRELQLRRHLEGYSLARAVIDGIAEGRKTTLRSFNIETACDIERLAIADIPGFGPVLTGKLLRWRQSIERSFKFNPALPTDPQAIAQVKGEIAATRASLQSQLVKGATDLDTIRTGILASRRHPQRHEPALKEFLQAQIDLRFVS